MSHSFESLLSSSGQRIKRASDHIKSVFGLSDKQLAAVCRFEKDGQGGVAALSERLFYLSAIATSWIEGGYATPTSYELNRASAMGDSLFDALQSPILDEALVMFMGSRMYLQSPSMGQLGDPFS